MPTRFYLPNAGTPAISPAFDAGWEQTGQADRMILVRKGIGTTPAALAYKQVTVPITTTQQILMRQFVGEPFPERGRIAGTVSMVMRCDESNAAANCFLAYVLRVCSNDGNTFRGTLASSMTNAGTEFPTTDATRIFSAVALTALTYEQGDRLVLEIGAHAQAPTSAQTCQVQFGVPADTADFALTSALTTQLRPWIEFSEDLWPPLSVNRQGYASTDSGVRVSGLAYR